ncbi:hypothetical protein [Streptomyces sp. Act143]|uniref:hypothetical protein n=1 Tax=Streptomyces sp. Act143 TaxID=2200760 RepID=UPI0015E7F786|nr:hypothetical protein [Streptomyces sp. Act143]
MDALRRACVLALLAVAYLFVVVPAGMVARLLRDPLDRALRPDARTYWSGPRA